MRTSPAAGATSLSSPISSVIRSVFSRRSSTWISSSSSSWNRMADMTLHFSRNLIRRQALRMVVWMSRSTSATSFWASPAACMAANRSVPGFSPSANPMRRCSTASMDWNRTRGALPSRRTLPSVSLSNRSGRVSASRRLLHNSMATMSGSYSATSLRAASALALEMCAVPSKRRLSSMSTTVMNSTPDVA